MSTQASNPYTGSTESDSVYSPALYLRNMEAIAMRIVAKAVDFQVPKIAAEVAELHVIRADERRQKVEDVRANRRNRNRTYTLVVALLMTFMVPYIVANVIGAAWLLKYATGIAIIPDALITLYAYWRKY